MAAYIVFHNRVFNPDAMGAYLEKAGKSLAPHGAEILVLEDSSEVIEGSTEMVRTVVIRFESRERAQAWYNSPEYQAALPIRLGASEGFGVLADGFEAPART